MKQDDRDTARGVLQRVRPSGYDVEGELDEMAELAHVEKTASTRGWPGLREAWARPALVLGCGIAIFTLEEIESKLGKGEFRPADFAR